jgi:hypothetical protein
MVPKGKRSKRTFFSIQDRNTGLRRCGDQRANGKYPSAARFNEAAVCVGGPGAARRRQNKKT